MTVCYPQYRPQRRLPSGYRYTQIGYRTYVSGRRFHFAGDNLKRYRQLILDAKNKDEFAVTLLASLLCLVYDEVIGGADAIACVPTSKKSKPVRDDAIALLAQKANALGLRVIDGTSWLKRRYDVPSTRDDPAMRTFSKQYETIECGHVRTDQMPQSIVVIDDISTTGSTMDACVARLRERFPAATITGFAFGSTEFVDKSPAIPVFPKSNQPLAAVPTIVDGWRDETWPRPADGVSSPFFAAHGIVHRADGSCFRPAAESKLVWSKTEADTNGLSECPRCRPFRKRPRFVMNFYSHKIHHVDCHTGPWGNGHEELWSLRQGIRLGGAPCSNCMPRWPIAELLYKERRKKPA